MALKTYSGSCHCGAVRYEADLDLAAGTTRCNCSLCAKARAWFAFAKGASAFRPLAGVDALSNYRWTPEGKPSPHLTYAFCKHCGIRVFAQGNMEALGGVFHAVPVATLDDARDDLLASPIHYVDGLHDRYDRTPENTHII